MNAMRFIKLHSRYVRKEPEVLFYKATNKWFSHEGHNRVTRGVFCFKSWKKHAYSDISTCFLMNSKQKKSQKFYFIKQQTNHGPWKCFLGDKHCIYTGGCTTKKCACKKVGRKCNSRCYHSKTCQNKWYIYLDLFYYLLCLTLCKFVIVKLLSF
jgi:hypothetical protein